SATVWDLRTGKGVASLREHEGAVVSVAFGPEGERLLTATREGTVRLFDVRTAKEVLRLPSEGPGAGAGAAWSADGHRLATARGARGGRDDPRARLRRPARGARAPRARGRRQRRRLHAGRPRRLGRSGPDRPGLGRREREGDRARGARGSRHVGRGERRRELR